MRNKLNTLSERQLEIIEFLKKGLSSKEIAAILYISVKTVEVHRYNILKKLGFKNTASVIDFYNKN
jgi:DNA-binding NarL/FixJ family response regulator